MSETTNSFLIAVGILFVLTLADPFVDSLFAMLRRDAQRQVAADDAETGTQTAPSYKRDAA